MIDSKLYGNIIAISALTSNFIFPRFPLVITFIFHWIEHHTSYHFSHEVSKGREQKCTHLASTFITVWKKDLWKEVQQGQMLCKKTFSTMLQWVVAYNETLALYWRTWGFSSLFNSFIIDGIRQTDAMLIFSHAKMLFDFFIRVLGNVPRLLISLSFVIFF